MLRDAGLVITERQGQEIYYEVNTSMSHRLNVPQYALAVSGPVNAGHYADVRPLSLGWLWIVGQAGHVGHGAQR